MNTVKLSANTVSSYLSKETCKLLGTRNFHPYWNGLAMDSVLGEIDINDKDPLCDIRIDKLKLLDIPFSELNECLQAQFYNIDCAEVI